jgi:G3E family GTPase
MERIPLVIVTGFLGAGKTTFLNRLIGAGALEGAAFLVNEFGEASLDHMLVDAPAGQVVELSNGCICCSVRGDYVDALETVAARRPKIAVIETTGLADPGPLLQAGFAHPLLARAYAAPAVIAIADAPGIAANLERFEEARRQIAFADIVAISKSDLFEPQDRAVAFERASVAVRAVNARARIVGADASGEQAAALVREALASIGEPERHGAAAHGHDHHHDHGHGHEHGHVHSQRYRSAVIALDRPIPASALEMFLELVASAHAREALRVKGLVAVEGRAGPVLVQGAQGVFAEPRELGQWPGDDAGKRRETRVTVITQDMDPQFLVRLFHGFANSPLPDTPDREALTHNPLAIPGYRPS